MITTQVLVDMVKQAVVDMPVWLAASPDLTIALVVNNFTPGLTLSYGALEFAASTGLGPITVIDTSGRIIPVWDVAGGRWGFRLKEPIGGFTWVVSAVADPAEQVYGYVLVDAAEPDVYAAFKFDAPIPITAVGQSIEVSSVLAWLARLGLDNLPT